MALFGAMLVLCAESKQGYASQTRCYVVYRHFSEYSTEIQADRDRVIPRQTPFPQTDKDEVRSSSLRAPTHKAFHSNKLWKAFLMAYRWGLAWGYAGVTASKIFWHPARNGHMRKIGGTVAGGRRWWPVTQPPIFTIPHLAVPSIGDMHDWLGLL